MKTEDFLLEIQTEELPPGDLEKLSLALKQNLCDELEKYDVRKKDKETVAFATPRRLAVLVKNLPAVFIQTVSGPFFDESGAPTKACEGFAQNWGVAVSSLGREAVNGKERAVYLHHQKISEVMPEIVHEAVCRLEISKKMHWGDYEESFVRPVHGVVLLYGDRVIETELLGKKTGRATTGHRFHHPKVIQIKKPADYEAALHKAFVIADFDQRKKIIREQVDKLAQSMAGKILWNAALLHKVTGMVEWPNALLVPFDEKYLKLPKEVLIACIEGHQQCFPIAETGNDYLKPYSVFVSNIDSKKPDVVKAGNAFIMNGRFQDAAFFYETDVKTALEEYIPRLKDVVFEKELGTLHDKTSRVMKLSRWISEKIGANPIAAERAALLSKADLVTQMVGEFPELQGIMGDYYARQSGEPDNVAIAIREQYLPHHAGDELPKTTVGQALALASRVDTLIGIFGVNKKPTGDKDPFGLRRAALGIIRIILESKEALVMDVFELLTVARNYYGDKLPNTKIVREVFEFISERLKFWLVEKQFAVDEIQAVETVQSYYLKDIVARLEAVRSFRTLKEASDLAAANKRVANLLKQKTESLAGYSVDENLLLEPAEKQLFKIVQSKAVNAEKYVQSKQYETLLKDLANLSEPVNTFFDQVMVMTDDEKIRLNRLILLAQLRALFLKVADISLLQL